MKVFLNLKKIYQFFFKKIISNIKKKGAYKLNILKYKNCK